MVSTKLVQLFYLTVGLLYFHAVEEVLTGFPSSDSFKVVRGKMLGTTPASHGSLWNCVFGRVSPLD